jgi:hypothetical protein
LGQIFTSSSTPADLFFDSKLTELPYQKLFGTETALDTARMK